MLNPKYPQDQTIAAKPATLKLLVIALSKEKPVVALSLDSAADDAACFLLADIFQILVACTVAQKLKHKEINLIYTKTVIFWITLVHSLVTMNFKTYDTVAVFQDCCC